MPEINDIIRADKLGFVSHAKYIYVACNECGERRWQLYKYAQKSTRCPKCTNKYRNLYKVLEKNTEWKRDDKGNVVYKLPCNNCNTVMWKLWRDRNRLCKKCSYKLVIENNKNSSNHGIKWNGGRYITSSGYVMVYIESNNPYFDTAISSRNKNGYSAYIQEHRLVMAQFLGRNLKPYEIVHHKNRIKNDNRIENLELMPNQTRHLSDTFKDNYIEKLENKVKDLEDRIVELEKEVKLNTWHIKDINKQKKRQDSEIVRTCEKSQTNEASSRRSCSYGSCKTDVTQNKQGRCNSLPCTTIKNKR